MAKKHKDKHTTIENWFEDLKKEFLKIDPVSFCEAHLTVGSDPLKLSGTGWKFLADIYRYVALEAIDKNSKPVVCVKGRQVGATTMATALELYFCSSGLFGTSSENPPIRILHCFPHLANVQKFSKDKLSTMIRTSVDDYVLKQSLSYDGKTGKKRTDVPEDTLTEKQFKNENKLWVESNANDAIRLQGMSLDAIFYDEVQHMLQDDIGNSKRTLTAARYGPIGQGIQLYFGTPLQRGSYFHKIWEASDQRVYHLRCVDNECGHLFPLYKPGDEAWWETVWLFGNTIECPQCKNRMSKVDAVELGQWIPTKQKMSNGEPPLYVGFHFNQLLLPTFTKEIIERERPENNPNTSDRVWKQEILGEFYSGTDLPMSKEEIHQFCRDTSRKISFGNSENKDMFMGIDWGSKTDDSRGGQSFSTICVISVSANGTYHIENSFKLKKNDFEHKKEVVAEMFRRYKIKVAVADFGHGNDIVPELQKEYGARFLACFNSGNLTNPYKYDPEDLRIICNIHMALDELFTQMRKSRVKFPWQSYEQIQWLIDHCCSMEKDERIFQGEKYPRFKKGNSPNDGLMSLQNAVLAYKFYLTKGFNVKAHQIGPKSRGPILAYLPNI